MSIDKEVRGQLALLVKHPAFNLQQQKDPVKAFLHHFQRPLHLIRLQSKYFYFKLPFEVVGQLVFETDHHSSEHELSSK
jgi:hypothetical protein